MMSAVPEPERGFTGEGTGTTYGSSSGLSLGLSGRGPGFLVPASSSSGGTSAGGSTGCSSLGSGDDHMDEGLKALERLKFLWEAGHLTQEDYETRKSSIIDELTFTDSSRKRSSASTLRRTKLPPSIREDRAEDYKELGRSHKRKSRLAVIPHEPSDSNWERIRTEKAVKFSYDYVTDKWKEERVQVKIDEVPFDKGGLRYVFHMKVISGGRRHAGHGDMSDVTWVAKMSQDARDSVKRDIYLQDVKIQAIARYFCHCERGYNSYSGIQKKVDFLEAFVVRLMQREGSPVCHMERYIAGEYQKHNNNGGWVNTDAVRNTPQAFAHFTYEASKHKLLICDIQGVGDVYTDPQIHTCSHEKDYGKGNRGAEGFRAFLDTHQCNPICKHLKLPNVNQLPIQSEGVTRTAKTFMAADRFSTVVFDPEKGSVSTLPLLADRLPPLKEDSSSTGCWCAIL